MQNAGDGATLYRLNSVKEKKKYTLHMLFFLAFSTKQVITEKQEEDCCYFNYFKGEYNIFCINMLVRKTFSLFCHLFLIL